MVGERRALGSLQGPGCDGLPVSLNLLLEASGHSLAINFMNEGKVTIERRGHVLLIGLDRVPKRNAFDVAMYHDLAIAYGTLDRDQDLRCGVLFAHGDHFTAGIDLAQWSPLLSAGRFPTLPEGAIDPLGLDETRRLRKPVVMAVQGICFTIGIELLLATEVRVAAATTRFAQIEIKRGIYPVGGATVRLIQEVGLEERYALPADRRRIQRGGCFANWSGAGSC